jgi:hypothetical protein
MISLALVVASVAGGVPADTIPNAPVPVHSGLLGLPEIGGIHDVRSRTAQLRGRSGSEGYLVRSPSSLLKVEDRVGWHFLAPSLSTIYNSDIPLSLNEAGLWAGRGAGVRLGAGLTATLGPATLILFPEIIHESNRPFQIFHLPDHLVSAPGRSHFASPFRSPPSSMDLPLRFGTRSRQRVSPGQSSLTIRAGAAAFGVATENQWWGPGVRNALVMSNNAPGMPHLFVRTNDPLPLRWGTVEGRWIVARMSESDFFDFDRSNDRRSLSAAALVFTPAVEPNVSIGLTRSVYRVNTRTVPLNAAFDVFRNVGRPGQEPGDSMVAPGPDQIFSLFGRFIAPAAGLEAYAEWGRYEQPASLRDLLAAPHHSQGYTLGMQVTRPAFWQRNVRLHGEFTNLEPSRTFRVREARDWYSSRRVPQGYTHQGRVVGAAIGPSGSSQWASIDLDGERSSIGLFGGRTRWEGLAYVDYPPEFRKADVSLYGGVRGNLDAGPLALSLEYTSTARLNYLFQAQPTSHIGYRGVDISNHTFRLTVGPGRRWF